MSGRWLLDAAALLKASRGVASRHAALISASVDTYTKTSSLARAVVKAASAPPQRPNEAAPQHSTIAENLPANGPIPSKPSVEGSRNDTRCEGLRQDHFYEKSGANSAAEPASHGDLSVRQEQAARSPLPDGTIPPCDSSIGTYPTGNGTFSKADGAAPAKGPMGESGGQSGSDVSGDGTGKTPDPAANGAYLSAEKARGLRRQAGSQIPSQAGQGPLEESSIGDGDAPVEAELEVDQEKDVYYTASPDAATILSSLPRVRLPETADNTQESDEHLPDSGMNQDVFYSHNPHASDKAIHQERAEDPLSDDVYKQLFQGSRIARMLKGKGKSKATSQGLNVRGPDAVTAQQQEPERDVGNETRPLEKDSATVSEPNPSAQNAEGEDVRNSGANASRESRLAASKGPEVGPHQRDQVHSR
jgi:aarF domain-containing kinase